MSGNTTSSRAVFKRCLGCDRTWNGRSEFLCGHNVELVGYQVNFDELELGFLLFNHLSCRSTISVRAGQFVDLYDGPTFEERKTGSQECPGYCVHEDELEPCPASCECSYVRSAIQVIRSWPRDATPASRDPAETHAEGNRTCRSN